MNCVVCTVDDGEFDWMAACVETEQQYRRWSDFEKEVNQYYLSASGFNVDAVHVLQVWSTGGVLGRQNPSSEQQPSKYGHR